MLLENFTREQMYHSCSFPPLPDPPSPDPPPLSLIHDLLFFNIILIYPL